MKVCMATCLDCYWQVCSEPYSAASLLMKSDISKKGYILNLCVSWAQITNKTGLDPCGLALDMNLWLIERDPGGPQLSGFSQYAAVVLWGQDSQSSTWDQTPKSADKAITQHLVTFDQAQNRVISVSKKKNTLQLWRTVKGNWECSFDQFYFYFFSWYKIEAVHWICFVALVEQN